MAAHRRMTWWRIVLMALLAASTAACTDASMASTAATGSAESAAGTTTTASTSPASPGGTTKPSPKATVSANLVSGSQRFTQIASDTGPILQTTLVGPRSGVTMSVWVWLPPQYNQPAYAHTAFPALMLYPGGAGVGHNAWVGTSLGARQLVASGSLRGTVTPFVFVMPAMQLSLNQDTECADLPGQPKVGTFLSVDVPQMVEANFRVRRDRAGWGAAGASSGAYCATRLVFNHPDQYAAVVSLGGYFTIETNLPGNTDRTVRAGDPAALAISAPPDVSVLLWSGSSGADLVNAQRFLAEVRSPTHAQLRTLAGGQHLTVDFAKMIPGSLSFLTAHVAGPAPMATN